MIVRTQKRVCFGELLNFGLKQVILYLSVRFWPHIMDVRRAEKEASRRIGRFRSLPYIIIYSEGKANMQFQPSQQDGGSTTDKFFLGGKKNPPQNKLLLNRPIICDTMSYK